MKLLHIRAAIPNGWFRIAVVVGLFAGPLNGALYHCRESGRLLAAPCAGERGAARQAGDHCCDGDAARPPAPAAKCCNLIVGAPPMLAGSVLLDRQQLQPVPLTAAEPCGPLPPRALPADRLRGLPPPAPDPSCFLLQCRYLC